MKRISLAALAFLFTCLFGVSAAFAQTDVPGMILQANIQVPVYKGASVSLGNEEIEVNVGALKAAGPGLDLVFGYKWVHFGIGIEQQLDLLVATSNAMPAKWKIDDDGPNFIEKNDPIFHGATYLYLMEFITINSDAWISIGQGIGAAYGSGKNYLFVTDTDAAFAFKLDLGFTYFLFSQYGLGVDLEWAGALAFDDGVSMSWWISPKLTYTMVF